MHNPGALLYIVLLLAGACLLVWTMQLIAHSNFLTTNEPRAIMHARRVALVMMALGMLWAASLCADYDWQPIWADFIIIGGVDLYFGLAILSASCRASKLSPQTT